MATLEYDSIVGADPVMFTAPYAYSMEAAVTILENLETNYGCVVDAKNWRTPSYGSLVEIGVIVRMENIVFRVMCSYEHIFVYRVSGNRQKFHNICEAISKMNV